MLDKYWQVVSDKWFPLKLAAAPCAGGGRLRGRAEHEEAAHPGELQASGGGAAVDGEGPAPQLHGAEAPPAEPHAHAPLASGGPAAASKAQGKGTPHEAEGVQGRVAHAAGGAVRPEPLRLHSRRLALRGRRGRLGPVSGQREALRAALRQREHADVAPNNTTVVNSTNATSVTSLT